jgi:pimeloyl-ACP methyl ester carboxylesterase
VRTVRTDVLEIAFADEGPATGWPVVLAHGFPYDVHAYDEVVPRLVRAGARVIVPYLRGFGRTSFLSTTTMRSGQQAALGRDLIGLLDGLGVKRAILAGYDWGGLASCVASALWPERVAGLVSYAGYDIIDVERNGHAYEPALEQILWYQHLFQLERGRECLTLHRRELCRILWEQWSPGWKFDTATFERSATSFDNPDFVDVVIHCYRFVFGSAAGDPALASLEERLAEKPKISVPTITLDGARDPLKPGGTASHALMFRGRHEHRVVDCGHNLPWEAPE